MENLNLEEIDNLTISKKEISELLSDNNSRPIALSLIRHFLNWASFNFNATDIDNTIIVEYINEMINERSEGK